MPMPVITTRLAININIRFSPTRQHYPKGYRIGVEIFCKDIYFFVNGTIKVEKNNK
jgi:hypothetical protein